MRVWFWIIIGCLVGLHPNAARSQSTVQNRIDKLRQIIPIRSTAENVKKLLGEPIRKSPDFYKFDEFNVMVNYSSGLPCDPDCVKKDEYCGWNVPRGTVITFVISVKVDLHQKDLKSLSIDLSKYKQERASDFGSSIYYSNAEEGIGVIINGDQVDSISLFPAKKYFHLMCPQLKEKPVTQAYYWQPTNSGNDKRHIYAFADTDAITNAVIGGLEPGRWRVKYKDFNSPSYVTQELELRIGEVQSPCSSQ
jgi:hypothetical protein